MTLTYYQPVCHDPVNGCIVYQSSTVYESITDAYYALCDMPMELVPYYSRIEGEAVPLSGMRDDMLHSLTNIMRFLPSDAIFRYTAPGAYYDVMTARVVRLVFEVAPLRVSEDSHIPPLDDITSEYSDSIDCIGHGHTFDEVHPPPIPPPLPPSFDSDT